MKLLVVDADCCGLAFCHRASQFGHQVRWYVKPSKSNSSDAGDGFKLQRVDELAPSMEWSDLIFATGNSAFLPQLERAKRRGKLVFAPSIQSADLEIKRAEGMKFFESHGIEVPSYKTFANLKEVESYVEKKPGRYVFKTLGDNEDKSLSYCAKSPADMIARLHRWTEMGMNPKGEVMLQEFIPGIEFAVSRWMGSKGWVGRPNENFEFKKLMPGDCGPNTGEMGTVMAYVDKSKLFEEVLAPLENDLLKMGHLGDVDVNCIIDEKGKAWPLEFTCRPGWPAFNIMLSEHKGDPLSWMVGAINGKDGLNESTDIAIGVVLAIPNFPYENADHQEVTGIPIYGVGKNERYIQPSDVKIATLPQMEGEKVVDKPMWSTAGSYVAIVTGMGSTVSKAQTRVYGTVDEISISNMFYRKDIGDRLEKDLEVLHKQGYATHFRY